MIIIDANNRILGRIATFIAKKALLGEAISVINCEKALMTGNRKMILMRYKQKNQMGKPMKGPFFTKRADRFVRRTIRGMLPYKQEKGRNAFRSIKCYIGVPEEFKDKKTEAVGEADIVKVPNLKYITIGEICKSMGGKW